jgi:hypothetical protein
MIPQIKSDMMLAAVVTAWSFGGMTLNEVLTTGQLIMSVTGGTVGTGYMAWKWLKEYRHSKRRNRRKSD